MKTVVALWHSKDKGKTDTLRELARLLLAHSTCNTILSIPLEIRDDMDFRLIIEINKRRIGIESQGDPDTDIEKRLIELAVSCDFIICATRTKGETVSAVNRLCQDNKFQAIWTSTYQTENNTDDNLQEELNKLKAAHLLDLIKHYCFLYN